MSTRTLPRPLRRSWVAILLAILVVPSSAAAQGSNKKTAMVPMRDGVKLYTEYVLPTVGKGPWPVVLLRSPYALGSNPWEKQIEPAVNWGVAIVYQLMRGRFKSGGEDTVFGDSKPDGADSVAWVKKQPWCNGKVSTAGPSALGIHQ